MINISVGKQAYDTTGPSVNCVGVTMLLPFSVLNTEHQTVTNLTAAAAAMCFAHSAAVEERVDFGDEKAE